MGASRDCRDLLKRASLVAPGDGVAERCIGVRSSFRGYVYRPDAMLAHSEVDRRVEPLDDGGAG